MPDNPNRTPLFAKIVSIAQVGESHFSVRLQRADGREAAIVVRFTRPGSCDYPFPSDEFDKTFRSPHAARIAAHYANELVKGAALSFPIDLGDLSVEGFFEDPLRRTPGRGE